MIRGRIGGGWVNGRGNNNHACSKLSGDVQLEYVGIRPVRRLTRTVSCTNLGGSWDHFLDGDWYEKFDDRVEIQPYESYNDYGFRVARRRRAT